MTAQDNRRGQGEGWNQCWIPSCRQSSVFVPFDLMEGGGCGVQWFPVEASSAGTLHGNDLSPAKARRHSQSMLGYAPGCPISSACPTLSFTVSLTPKIQTPESCVRRSQAQMIRTWAFPWKRTVIHIYKYKCKQTCYTCIDIKDTYSDMKELNILMPILQLEVLNATKHKWTRPTTGLSAHTEFFHLISNCSATLAPPTEHAVFPAPCKQDAQDLSAC